MSGLWVATSILASVNVTKSAGLSGNEFINEKLQSQQLKHQENVLNLFQVQKRHQNNVNDLSIVYVKRNTV